MKAKFLKIVKRIGIGAGILLILIVGLVLMAMLSTLEVDDMSEQEKVAYAKGQHDAMKGDIRITPTNADSTEWKQTLNFKDTEDKFIETKFKTPKKIKK